MHMKVKVSIVEARHSDSKEIHELLKKYRLPTKDLSYSKVKFFVARSETMVLACAGIEQFENKGLLRSVAVKKELTKEGLGTFLISEVIMRAKKNGIEALFLLTETAEPFFKKMGFKNINRELAPDGIKDSSEFAGLCPTSAIFMTKEI